MKITLAAARVNAGYTQADVVKVLNVTPATLVAWEKGSAEPKVTQARKLASLYKMPLENIFFGEEIHSK